MNARSASVTHYQSSKGPVEIATMPFTYANNARAKLLRDEPHRTGEIAALMDHMDALDAQRQAAEAGEPVAEVRSSPQPIGHNQPPATPTTFEEAKRQIEDLYGEARNWLDGQPIENQAQADEVARLRGMMKEAAAQAETLRVAEKKPLDEQVAAVQAKYAPLIADTKSLKGLTVIADKALLAALTPWLEKLDREHQERLDAARREAEAAIEDVQIVHEAADPTRLDDAEVVEETIQIARQAQRDLRVEEGSRARVGGGEFRSTLLRDNWVPHLTDADAALAHYWKMQRGALEAFLCDLAAKDVRAGKRTIPGFDVKNDKRAA